MPGYTGPGQYIRYDDLSSFQRIYAVDYARSTGEIPVSPVAVREQRPRFRKGDRIAVRGWSCLVYFVEQEYVYVMPLGVTRYFKFSINAVLPEVTFFREEAVHA